MSETGLESPIEDYLAEKSGMKASTYKNHKSVATRFGEWVTENRDADTILDTGPRDVRDWLQELDEDGYAGSTVHQYHAILRAFFAEWTDGNEASMLPVCLDENPAAFELSRYLDAATTAEKQQYADNDEGVIHLNPSEIEDLRNHVPDPKVRNELVVKMLVQTGMRAVELSSFKIHQLDRDAGRVQIADPKTDDTRTVPYQDLEPELSMWLDGGYRDRFERADDSPYLFLTRESEKLSRRRITTMIRDGAKDAGIQETWGDGADGRTKFRVTPHALRSTFIMRLFDVGLAVPRVMKLAGHDRLKTTQKYANAAREGAISAYEDADIDFGT